MTFSQKASLPNTAPDQPQSKTGDVAQVIVVEDNADFRDLLCEMLSMLDYGVISAASAEEALDMLQKDRADVLISDVSLPGISGVDLAKQVHVAKPEMKIILSSGYGDSVAAQLKFPVTVLSKPYTLTQLAAALNASGG